MTIEIVFWMAVLYVVTIYPSIKYIQEVRRDLREGATEHPMNLFINL